LEQSETFSDVYWAKTGTVASTITANTASSPTGTLTADAFTPGVTGNAPTNLSTGSNRIFRDLETNFAGTYTLSIWVKTDSVNTNFTLFRGRRASDVIVAQTNGTTTSQWQRVTVSGSDSVTGARFVFSSTEKCLIWGAQLVEGTDAKPYFATTNRQDVPRIDYRNADGSVSSTGRLLLEPQRTNGIRNSTMVGAVAGSPGTLPTNWGQGGWTSLTRQIVATPVVNGLQCIDIRFSGTASQNTMQIVPESITQIAASAGQVWTASYYASVVAAPNPYNSANASIFWTGGVPGTPQTTTLTSTLSRFAVTGTAPASTTHGTPAITFALTIGTTYDFTIRIAAPQMELGAYATTFIPTNTAAVTRILDGFTRSNIFTNGFITAAGGTWFVDLSSNLALVRDGAMTGLSLDSSAGSFTNGFNIRNTGGTSRLNISKWQATVGASLYTTLTDNVKIAIKWNGTTADVFANGVKVVSATAFTPTSLQFLSATALSGVPYNFNQLALFPTPLTDAQCIQITTL
jgi:hypothetical protein